MLDYAFDEYFVTLYFFHTGVKRKYNFFKQLVVELACRVQRFTTSLQQFIHISDIYCYDNALPV